MFVPSSSASALALLLVNLLCWGSWGNCAKWSTLPFPAFYAIFSCGCFFWSAVLGLVLGSDLYAADDKHRDFAANLASAGLDLPVLFACLAGVLFNVGNVLLTLLITLVGLATAFPVCIGTALVVGTLLSYVIEPGQTEFGLLCLGVLLAVCALLAMAGAQGLKDRRGGPTAKLAPQEVGPSADSAAAVSADTTTLMNAARDEADEPTAAAAAAPPLRGAIMGGFAPLETLAQDGAVYGEQRALIPYACSLYFCLAAMVSSAPICLLLARRPISGPRVPSLARAMATAGVKSCAMPFLGAGVWTVGTTLNFVAGKAFSSQAVAYSIAQSAPMVAALWGVCVFGEFRGAPLRAWLLLLLMFACYSAAVVTIALASGSV